MPWLFPKAERSARPGQHTHWSRWSLHSANSKSKALEHHTNALVSLVGIGENAILVPQAAELSSLGGRRGRLRLLLWGFFDCSKRSLGLLGCLSGRDSAEGCSTRAAGGSTHGWEVTLVVKANVSFAPKSGGPCFERWR